MEDPLFGALIALIFLLGGFYWWFVSLKHARVITDTPTSLIRSAPQGYVELVGTAKSLPGVNTVSPLSQTQCVWYRFLVERRQRGNNGTKWVTERRGVSDQNFLLVDPTGECIVDPEGADVIANHKQVWYGPTPHAIRYDGNAKYGFLYLGETYRYTEHLMFEGDLLYALGFFTTYQPASFSEQSQDRMKAILAAWKADYRTLLQRFDANRDGQVSMEEWEQARQVAEQQANAETQVEYDSHSYHILSRSPNTKQAWILSTRSPDALVKYYRWQMFGALLLMGVSLWVILFVLLPKAGWL